MTYKITNTMDCDRGFTLLGKTLTLKGGESMLTHKLPSGLSDVFSVEQVEESESFEKPIRKKNKEDKL